MKIITIGRSQENNNIIINDEKVSRNHLQLVQDDQGNCSVTDLGSTNGTFVNGQRISGQTPLHSGDELRIGNTILPWQDYFKNEQKGGAHMPSKPKAENGRVASSKSPKRKWWIWILIGAVIILLVGGIVLCTKSCSNTQLENEAPATPSIPEDTELIKAETDLAHAERDAAEAARNQAEAERKAAEKAREAEELAKIAAQTKSQKDIAAAKKAEVEAEQAKADAKQAKEDKKKADDKVEDLKKKVDDLNDKINKLNAKRIQDSTTIAEQKAADNLNTEMQKILNKWNPTTAKNFFNQQQNWGTATKNNAKNKIVDKFSSLSNTEKKNIVDKMKRFAEVKDEDDSEEATNSTPAPSQTTPQEPTEKEEKKQ